MGFFRVKKLTNKPSTFSGFSNYWKLNLETDIGLDVPCYFSVLHDLGVLWQTSEDEANNGDLSIHYVKGQPKPPLCNHLYFDEDDEDSDCEFCNSENSFGDPNTPVLVKSLIVVVHNLIGMTKPGKDEGTNYDVNPIRILEVPAGASRINLDEIEEAHRQGCLSRFDEEQSIWTIKKIQERNDNGTPKKTKAGNLKKKLIPPSMISGPAMRSLGNQFVMNFADLEENENEFLKKIHKDIMSFKSEKTPGEIMGLILDCYGNVKREHQIFQDLDVTWPEIPEKKEKKDDEDDNKDLDK